MDVQQILNFSVWGTKLFSDSMEYVAVFEVILELFYTFVCKAEECLTPRGWLQSAKLIYVGLMPYYMPEQRLIEGYAFSYKVTFVVVEERSELSAYFFPQPHPLYCICNQSNIPHRNFTYDTGCVLNKKRQIINSQLLFGSLDSVLCYIVCQCQNNISHVHSTF